MYGDWYYCEKCKEVIKQCEHLPNYKIISSDNTSGLHILNESKRDIQPQLFR